MHLYYWEKAIALKTFGDLSDDILLCHKNYKSFTIVNYFNYIHRLWEVLVLYTHNWMHSSLSLWFISDLLFHFFPKLLSSDCFSVKVIALCSWSSASYRFALKVPSLGQLMCCQVIHSSRLCLQVEHTNMHFECFLIATLIKCHPIEEIPLGHCIVVHTLVQHGSDEHQMRQLSMWWGALCVIASEMTRLGITLLHCTHFFFLRLLFQCKCVCPSWHFQLTFVHLTRSETKKRSTSEINFKRRQTNWRL